MQWGALMLWTRKNRLWQDENFAAHFQNALKNLSYRFGSAFCRVHGRQKEIARKMGVSEEVLPNWLNGAVPVTGEFFQDSRFSRKASQT
jgi:hypothetical protein